MKKGLVVVTYNSEKWFSELHKTIPLSKLDEVVIVNGGKEYESNYDCSKWIQHTTNKGAAQSRIDGIKELKSRGVEHIFVIEDDMLIKSDKIFDYYLDAYDETGLKYFCFCSTAYGNGTPGNRTPCEVVKYIDSSIAFYREMNNEFTYHHSSVFDKLGYYDCNFKHLWDVEFVYRLLSDREIGCGFRYFPDICNSDDLVCNNPNSIHNSRTNTNNSRDRELPIYFDMFYKKHGYFIQNTPILSREEFVKQLKYIYLKRP